LDISVGNKHTLYILHNGSDKGTERDRVGVNWIHMVQDTNEW